MTGGDGKVVCVTGAAGYIASWLIKLLLDGGYNVRATVRDPNDVKKTEHLVQLDGAKERLQLFRGNLMEEGSFDSIVDGCVGVFHTASPVFLETKDPQAELVDPAIKGTLNVLKSCAKANSIKRVVFTSSIAAVIHNDKPLGPDVVVDESWISDPEFCEKEKLWYMLGKTLAENAAWKFAKENGIDLVVINPGYVLGPPLQSTINFTLEILLKVVKGAPTFQNFTDRWVDVRDVANAHVQAFENPSANGRYCMAGRAAHWSEVVEILHQLFPDLRLPDKCEDDKPYAPAYQVSKEKAESLGIDFIPFETSLKDTIESFKERKYI